MSTFAAHLFSWVQDAEFYRDLHRQAADLMHGGNGRSWLDVGCGPGVLTRIAADNGYRALGIDRNPQMITAARRLAMDRSNGAKFEVADIDAAMARGERYDVVSASSLLVVLPDPEAALLQLKTLTRPGGSVLIIEASSQLTRLRAASEILSGRLGRRAYMLQVWATFRAGRTFSDDIFDRVRLPATHRTLLNGLVNAWTFKTPIALPAAADQGG